MVLHDQRGAWAITADDLVSSAARTVDVVDPTGAGDAFTAGYLSGWLDECPMAQRLHRAQHCATLAVATRGDNPLDVQRSVRDSKGRDSDRDGDDLR